MNDIFNRNSGLVFEENDNHYVDGIASSTRKVLESVMDTSADREAIENLTDTGVFQQELETIKNSDLSTREKLEAYSKVNDDWITAKERSAKMHVWMMAKKAGIVLGFLTVVSALVCVTGRSKGN